MSTQQMFTDAVTRVQKQRRPAIEGSAGPCRNRTEDGLKCAVGALIPDDRYHVKTEYWTPDEIYQHFLKDLYPDANVRVLELLRFAHDEAATQTRENYSSMNDELAKLAFVHAFTTRARLIAQDYGLKMPG